ncbi:hypothetical protein FB451DRAFT_1120 [Mycena latifolia]|nr:hypothetical protein FB451DRAFT_1120 [Mycena latifolia]
MYDKNTSNLWPMPRNTRNGKVTSSLPVSLVSTKPWRQLFSISFLGLWPPRFLIGDTNSVYNFSETRVDVVGQRNHIMNNVVVKRALRTSWVLIDVDGDPPEWFPDYWVEQARVLVLTSSPKETRMNHFIKQFKATPWYMKPWSLEEIAAATSLDKRD